MSDALLVGVDVGTTSCKVTVCTADGHEVANGKAPLTWQTTRHGTETDPMGVLSAVSTATALALARAPVGPVAAVGVTSMGEAGVLLDGQGAPLAPVIAWHDDRDGQEVADLGRPLHEEHHNANQHQNLGRVENRSRSDGRRVVAERS